MALKRQRFQYVSKLGLGRWQFARDTDIRKALSIVASVAKRLVGGVPAPAQRNDPSARESEHLAGRVGDFEFTLNAQRTVVERRDLGSHRLDGSMAAAGFFRHSPRWGLYP